MSLSPKTIRVEEIDWRQLFGWLRLFDVLWMAFNPGRLFLGVVLVGLAVLGGLAWDAVRGPAVYPDEFRCFAVVSGKEFHGWVAGRDQWAKDSLRGQLQDLTELEIEPGVLVESTDRFRLAREAVGRHYQKQLQQVMETAGGERSGGGSGERAMGLKRMRQERMAAIGALESRGVFRVVATEELEAFYRLARAATSLNFGFRALFMRATVDWQSVVGALRDMVVTTPRWLFHRHRVFLLAYGVYGLLIWSVLGGAIARLAALQACRSERGGIRAALGFSVKRWLWFFVSPVIPMLLVVLLGSLLALGGLVFFNWPGLEVVGALLFGLMLLCAVVIVVMCIGVGVCGNLLWPALAVEGTDAFDTISRCFNYVFGRPWRWLFYSCVSLVFCSFCGLLAAVLGSVSLSTARFFIHFGILRGGAAGGHRFDAVFPDSVVGHLHHLGGLDASGKAAGVILVMWLWLSLALWGAFVVNLYFSSNTLIYLLLRRSAEDTEFDEVWLDGDEAGAGGSTVPSSGEGGVGGPAGTATTSPA